MVSHTRWDGPNPLRSLLHTAAVLLQNGRVKNETSPEEYWAAVAEEIGEPVRAFALARLIDVSGSEQSGMFAPRQEWGLVFMTDSALYTERGGSQSWIQRLMTTRQRTDAPERRTIPIDSMTQVTIPPPKSGLRGLLAAPEVTVEIRYDGTPGLLRLVLDRRGQNDKNLVDLLSRVTPKNA